MIELWTTFILFWVCYTIFCLIISGNVTHYFNNIVSQESKETDKSKGGS